MTHIVTSLCLRDTACIEVCPVECMVPGQPSDQWPWIYIDPETCIDCGACIPECPYEAIFTEEEVPTDMVPTVEHEGRLLTSMPVGSDGYDDTIEVDGATIYVKEHEAGTELDLTADIKPNYTFFEDGPGYDAAQLANVSDNLELFREPF